MSTLLPATRKNIHHRADGRCEYCGVPCGMRTGTVDHYMPQALGGTNARRNLRWACRGCNELKADMHPGVWELVKPPRKEPVKTKYDIKCELISGAIKRHRNESTTRLTGTT